MAKDAFHNIVKAALQYVDLGAEQLIPAEPDQIKIAIEVKSFIGASAISEFHNAHGQFLDYRFALEEEEPDRKLFLAVPVKTYRTFFSLRFIQTVTQRSQISLVIYDPEQEVIVQWQP